MFSRNKIETKIDQVSLNLIKRSPLDSQGRALFVPGFRLTYHTIPQVESANAHLREVAKKRNWLTPEELRWIKNERLLCSIDFLYWATRYAYIVGWEDQLIRFNPNLPQRMILELMADMDEKGFTVLLQVLKARQEGVTTLSELILLWRTIFHQYSNVLVASSRPDKSAAMVEKMNIAYINMPSWLAPPIKTQNKGEYVGFDTIHSRIHIRHGAQLSGLGRGDTYSAFHLSEVAEFANADKDIDAALLKAFHHSPGKIGILEGTGEGRSGWWYDEWNANVEDYPQGESPICPVFLPYYALRDIYPTVTWSKEHPTSWRDDSDIPDIVKEHARNAEEYVQSGQNILLTKELGPHWHMPLEQMWFWWLERKRALRKKKLNIFYQEMCSTDKEAFQNPNASIFPIEITESFRSAARMPWGVYGIKAPQAEIPVELQARSLDIDPNIKPIDIHANWNPTGASHDYRLVPLLHRGAAPFSPNGKIIIYEPPKTGEVYVLGTDISNGLGKDFSVIEGLKKGNEFHNDLQAFEFASQHISASVLWPFNLALGTLYSVPRQGMKRQSLQVIEGNLNGELVYNELKKRGWREFHNWVRTDRKRIIEAKANRQLWYTTSWSRPLLWDMLLDALNNGWLDINSPWFIDDMADLELYEETNKIAAATGKHDDRLMALGIALYSAHILETKGQDGWATRRAREKGEEPFQYLSYSPGSQGTVDSDHYDSPEPSYTYKVINPGDAWEDELRESGASIWTPGR